LQVKVAVVITLTVKRIVSLQAFIQSLFGAVLVIIKPNEIIIGAIKGVINQTIFEMGWKTIHSKFNIEIGMQIK